MKNIFLFLFLFFTINMAFGQGHVIGGGGGGTLQETMDLGSTTTTRFYLDTTFLQPPLFSTYTKNWLRFRPLNKGLGSTDFLFGQSVTTANSSGEDETNEVFMWGWNLQPGGGSEIPGEPAIGYALEQRFDVTGVGADPLTEAHLHFVDTAGTQHRLFSYTINSNTAQGSLYHTVGAAGFRNTGGTYDYFSTTGSSTSASFSLRADNFIVPHGVEDQTTKLVYTINNQTPIDADLDEVTFSGFGLMRTPGSIEAIKSGGGTILFSDGSSTQYGSFSATVDEMRFNNIQDEEIIFETGANLLTIFVDKTETLEPLNIGFSGTGNGQLTSQNSDAAFGAAIYGDQRSSNSYGIGVHGIARGSGATGAGVYSQVLGSHTTKELYGGTLASGATNYGLRLLGGAKSYLTGDLGVGIDPTVRFQIRGTDASSATTSFLLEDNAGVDLWDFRNNGDGLMSNASGNMSWRWTSQDQIRLRLNSDGATAESDGILVFHDGGTRGSSYGEISLNSSFDSHSGSVGAGIYLDSRTGVDPLRFFVKPDGANSALAMSVASDGDVTINSGTLVVDEGVANTTTQAGDNHLFFSRTSDGAYVSGMQGDGLGGTEIFANTSVTMKANAATKLRATTDGVSISDASALTPDASSALDVQSTTGTFLPPRMTGAQADLISSPANGGVVYITTTGGTFTSLGLWLREEGSWVAIDTQKPNGFNIRSSDPGTLTPSPDQVEMLDGTSSGWTQDIDPSNLDVGDKIYIKVVNGVTNNITLDATSGEFYTDDSSTVATILVSSSRVDFILVWDGTDFWVF